MPRSDDGAPRYPKRPPPLPLARTILDGHDLGFAMRPADILVEVRRIMQLTDDEILAARAVTRSRLRAWRQHARPMTWPELRILLLGLRGLEE